MSRILGIDLGERRLGLAISDETHTLASSLEVYERRDLDADLSHIAALIIKEHISEIVLGLPTNMDGSLGPQAQRALEFKKLLEERLQLPVSTFDERLTTAEAERVLIEASVTRHKRKRIRDALAAVLILQSYLDSQR